VLLLDTPLGGKVVAKKITAEALDINSYRPTVKRKYVNAKNEKCLAAFMGAVGEKKNEHGLYTESSDLKSE